VVQTFQKIPPWKFEEYWIESDSHRPEASPLRRCYPLQLGFGRGRIVRCSEDEMRREYFLRYAPIYGRFSDRRYSLSVVALDSGYLVSWKNRNDDRSDERSLFERQYNGSALMT